MPKIAASLNEFHAYISQLEKNADSKNMPVVCLNFQPNKQKGQTCKLVAGYNAQHYLFSQKKNSLAPLPLYKNHGQHDNSLRQRAKETIHSNVGEVYGAEQLKTVLNQNAFQAISYALPDHDICMQFLKESLQHGMPVISYFDVAIKFNAVNPVGHPCNLQGDFEHAAVIIGYYMNNSNQMQLLAAQWGEYYEFPFEELFQSTCQISNIKLSEHYKKALPVPTFFDHPMWLELDQLDRMMAYNYANTKELSWALLRALKTVWPYLEERKSTPPTDSSGGLRSIFTVMKGDLQQDLNYLNQYSKYLAIKNEDENTASSSAQSNQFTT